MRWLEFADGTRCACNFFYVDGNDIHMVIDKKNLVEVSQILTDADLSKISVIVDGETAGTYYGYNTIVLLHPQENGVRVGLRKESLDGR